MPSIRTHRLAAVIVCSALLFLGGCSLVVMTQKMLFGDPKVSCIFKTRTGVDLVRNQKKVVVICTVPHAVENQYPSVASDILESVTLELKRNDVKVVSPSKVQEWFDDNNGLWNGITDAARSFDADFVIHIKLSVFTHKADKSAQMLQGVTHGMVHAYRVTRIGERVRTEEIYTDEDFSSTYPPHNPTPVTQISSDQFLRKYIERISSQLAKHFYDHTMSATVY